MGSATSTLPMAIDKERFRKLCRGTFNDPLFDAHAVNGLLSRDKLIELSMIPDCYFSYDDQGLRDTDIRLLEELNNFLHQKLCSSVFHLPPGNPRDFMEESCKAMETARCAIVVLSRGYLQRISQGPELDRNRIEFQYITCKKPLPVIIPVVIDEYAKNVSNWPSTLLKYFQKSNVFDLSYIQSKEERFNTLFQWIARIIRPDVVDQTMLSQTHRDFHYENKIGGTMYYGSATGNGTESFNPQNNTGSNLTASKGEGLHPGATREETQFYLWMEKRLQIAKHQRVLICQNIISAGVRNVTALAQQMTANPNFLLSLGVSDHDADEISKAVGSMGIGYTHTSNFQGFYDFDSAVFAIKKAIEASNDDRIAADALACIVRVSQKSPEMPRKLAEGGFCQAIMRLLQVHLAEPQVCENAAKAMTMLLEDNAELRLAILETPICFYVVRSIQSHLKSSATVAAMCELVATLALSIEFRYRLGTAGACEMVVKAVERHTNDPMVASQACYALEQLQIDYYENTTKMGIVSAHSIVAAALAAHVRSPSVVTYAFKTLTLIAQDPDSRQVLGTCVLHAVVEALTVHGEDLYIVKLGCTFLYWLVIANAANREKLGVVGICEVMVDVFKRFGLSHDDEFIFRGCLVLHSLANGSPDNYHRLQGALPVLRLVLERQEKLLSRDALGELHEACNRLTAGMP